MNNEFYTVEELLSFGFACIPSSVRGIRKKADREGWLKRQREGVKGKTFEYALSTLPQEIQAEILQRYVQQGMRGAGAGDGRQANPSTQGKALIGQDSGKRSSSAKGAGGAVVVVRGHHSLDTLTSKQREVAQARAQVASIVLEMANAFPRTKAIALFIEQVKVGALSDDVVALLAVANAKNGGGARLVSARTLHSWILAYEKAQTIEARLLALAPKRRQAQAVNNLTWLADFLGCYRKTNGVSVNEAYAEFVALWRMRFADEPLRLEMLPSIDKVRRALAKLPLHIKEIGRKTGAAKRAMSTYVKRDWSCLQVNDVWVGDGHSMKMKVAHPDHGRPFIPEVTLIMDACCRFIVGWSASLAENALAVADALRYGIEKHGIPAVYYSDNGGGEKNWLLDGDITGMLPRLGINHQTGIPGNPQGRGIIERVHQTILYRVARQFDTYHGSGADPDTVRAVSTGVVALDKAMQKNTALAHLTPKQRGAIGKLPKWDEFLQALEAGIYWYNHEHQHREIGGKTPYAKRREMMAQMNEQELCYITEVEARDLFRPEVVRTPERGWVRLFNGFYFHQKLLDVDGQKVRVAFDIHDPSKVIIRTLDGVFVCYAELDGNKREAFPLSFVEKVRKERYQRRVKLKQEQLKEIEQELNPVLSIEKSEGAQILHTLRVRDGVDVAQDSLEEIAVFPSELKRKQKKGV